MPPADVNTRPAHEAAQLLRAVRLGSLTFMEARETVRVTARQRRLLAPEDVHYRELVWAHFLNLVLPGSVALPAAPGPPPPPPPPASPPRTPSPRPSPS